jgi:hypothetical protein
MKQWTMLGLVRGSTKGLVDRPRNGPDQANVDEMPAQSHQSKEF